MLKKEDRVPLISQALKNSKADKSKLDKTTVLTSMKTLFEISNIKKTTNNSILKAIKESSVDCVIHSKSNKRRTSMLLIWLSLCKYIFFQTNYSTGKKRLC